MFLLATTFNCCAVWVKVVTAMRKMKQNGGTNLSTREFTLLALSGFILCGGLFVCLLSSLVTLAGAIIIVASLGLSVYCYCAGGRFEKALENMDGVSLVQKNVGSASRLITFTLAGVCVCTGVYAVQPRWPPGYIAVISINTTYTCGAATLWSITRYLRASESARRRKGMQIAPKDFGGESYVISDVTSTIA